MKKTLLATMMTSTLALTACGDKISSAANSNGNLNHDDPITKNIKTDALVTLQKKIALLQSNSDDVLKNINGVSVDDDIEEILNKINAEIDAHDNKAQNQAALANQQKLLATFTNISKTIQEHFKTLAATKFITDAKSHFLETEMAKQVDIIKLDEAKLTLKQVKKALDFMKNLIDLEVLSKKNKPLADAYHSILNDDFNEAFEEINKLHNVGDDGEIKQPKGNQEVAAKLVTLITHLNINERDDVAELLEILNKAKKPTKAKDENDLSENDSSKSNSYESDWYESDSYENYSYENYSYENYSYENYSYENYSYESDSSECDSSECDGDETDKD